MPSAASARRRTFFRRHHQRLSDPRAASFAARHLFLEQHPAVRALITDAIALREQLLSTAWLGTSPDNPGLRAKVRALFNFEPRRVLAEGVTVYRSDPDALTAERYVRDALHARGLFVAATVRPPKPAALDTIRTARVRKNARARLRARRGKQRRGEGTAAATQEEGTAT